MQPSVPLLTLLQACCRLTKAAGYYEFIPFSLLLASLSCRAHSFVDGYCSTFVDGYCSTVQGLLDWFEVDLGFTELSLIQIDSCVLCVSVLYSRVSLSSCPFLDILHCLPRAVGVPLESALCVSFMSCTFHSQSTSHCAIIFTHVYLNQPENTCLLCIVAVKPRR